MKGKIDLIIANMHDTTIAEDDIIFQLESIQDLKQIDKGGMTFLTAAACYNRINVLEYLLSRGMDVNDKDGMGYSALHLATRNGNLCLMEKLISVGADVNVKNNFGNNPIMMCNLATDSNVFEFLLSNGADPLQKNNFDCSAMDMYCGNERILNLLNKYMKV